MGETWSLHEDGQTDSVVNKKLSLYTYLFEGIKMSTFEDCIYVSFILTQLIKKSNTFYTSIITCLSMDNQSKYIQSKSTE